MKNLINHIEMYGVCNMSATIITRHKQKVALYSDIKYNLDGKSIGGIRTELSDRGIQIIDCKQIGAQTRSYFIGCSKEEVWNNIKALEMCEYIKMKYEICQETKLPFTSDGIDTSLPFPPICCYDGIEASISIERYKDKINEYKQRLIKLFNDKKNLSKYNKELCHSFLRREFNDMYNHIEYKMFRKGRFK